MDLGSLFAEEILLVLKLRIHCPDCEAKLLRGKTRLKKKLENVYGVDSVDIDSEDWIVVIHGSVYPHTILSVLGRRKIIADVLWCEAVEESQLHQVFDILLEDEVLTLSLINGVQIIQIRNITEADVEETQANRYGELEAGQMRTAQGEPSTSSAITQDQLNYFNDQPSSWPGGVLPTAPPIPPDYEASPSPPPRPPPPPPPPPHPFTYRPIYRRPTPPPPPPPPPHPYTYRPVYHHPTPPPPPPPPHPFTYRPIYRGSSPPPPPPPPPHPSTSQPIYRRPSPPPPHPSTNRPIYHRPTPPPPPPPPPSHPSTCRPIYRRPIPPPSPPPPPPHPFTYRPIYRRPSPPPPPPPPHPSIYRPIYRRPSPPPPPPPPLPRYVPSPPPSPPRSRPSSSSPPQTLSYPTTTVLSDHNTNGCTIL